MRASEILDHEAINLTGQTALMLIPALGGDLHFWDDFRTALGSSYPVVACDLRSSGRSARASQPVRLAQHVSDLDELRASLGLETIIPFGCAIGAMAAAAYAAVHPDSTAALILSNPALRTSPQAGAMLTDRAAQVRHGGMAAILPAAMERAFLEQPRDDRYARYVERFAAQDAEAYALSCLAAVDADITDELGQVRCPTLVIAGGHDVLLPPEQSRAVQALVPRSQFELVKQGAHFLPYQHPEIVVDLVRSFLTKSGIGGF